MSLWYVFRYRITLRSDKDAGEGDFRSGSVLPVEASTGISRIKETAHGYNERRK